MIHLKHIFLENMGDMFNAPQPDFDRYDTSGTTGFEGTKIDVKGYNPQGIVDEKPENTKLEKFTAILHKHIPSSPDKWEECVNAAKQKFDTYPSAHTNVWVAKKYSDMGGKWKRGNL